MWKNEIAIAISQTHHKVKGKKITGMGIFIPSSSRISSTGNKRNAMNKNIKNQITNHMRCFLLPLSNSASASLCSGLNK